MVEAGSSAHKSKIKFEQIFDNLDQNERKTKIICTMG
jgi:hypothetical protein